MLHVYIYIGNMGYNDSLYIGRFLPLALVIEQDEQDIVPLIWDRAS